MGCARPAAAEGVDTGLAPERSQASGESLDGSDVVTMPLATWLAA